MGWWAAWAGAAALWAGAAAADPFDSTPLFAVGSWSVEHTYDAGAGGSWCAADTVNAGGQWLSVVGYDNGEAAILVGDPGWRMEEGAVRFRIDVDGVGWEVDGSGGDGSLAVLMEDAASVATFLSGGHVRQVLQRQVASDFMRRHGERVSSAP